ncbi:MAG: GYF domain-containing protein [Fimbriimonadaceae bacterium]|nr:DUF4339 domain-containing protein [Chthonomonadaceae bacterium]MCO5296008.1 GYF domain-containing protein [Fimbriimonadaceae bacterium]
MGPLTREQIDELIDGGVIVRDTYVWRNGMPQWQLADSIQELAPNFKAAEPFSAPPPPPMAPGFGMSSAPNLGVTSAPMASRYPSAPPQVAHSGQYAPAFHPLTSDRSRVLAGVLQLLIPGVGRLYLGYAAYGVMQLLLFPCGLGIGWLWSVIDGIVILAGGVKLDGYGRQLSE